MEINKYSDIKGVVTLEAIVEGRMVLLSTNSLTHDFGSWADLPGARLPDTATEAQKAHFVITFAVDNSKPPIYQPYPSMTYALRQGFDQAANVPFDATVHMTPQSMKVGLTIPSGTLALAFGPGIFTVPSGAYVYSAGIEIPGTWLSVANGQDDGTDTGKLQEDADGSEGKFAQVERYDLPGFDGGNLTFKLNW